LVKQAFGIIVEEGEVEGEAVEIDCEFNKPLKSFFPMSFLIPKDRKVKFACYLLIHQLDNLPYLTGQYFAKWKLNYSTYKGITSRYDVR
jgi:hypothetical protein